MSMLKDWIFGLLGKETSREQMEIGRGADGEMSTEALRLWIRWSVMALGLCLVAVSVMASVSAVRNRREAAILEVDSGEVLEFYLNRKGTVLKTKADAAEVLKDHSLEEGIEKILQGFLDHGYLESDGAVIFTLRPSEAGVRADLERFAEEIHVYAEEFLRKKHSDGVVYVYVLEESAAVEELARAYDVSYGKAALVQDLVNENASLRNTDTERLFRMSVAEISEEMNERNYNTSFIEVVAKLVYAQMLEIEKETEVSEKETPAVEEIEIVKETEKASAVASTAAMETEAPENSEDSVEVTEESVEGEGSDAAETEEASAQESGEPETEEHLDASETEQETDHTDPAAVETELETTAAAETAPETSAETQSETTATEPAVQPEGAASGQVTPETAAPVETVQPQPETAASETSAAAQPETAAPEQTQPAGSIIEQVIPLTPAG